MTQISSGGGGHPRTGQVAERASVNPQTLRYYQRRGLVPEPARSPGGHRAYPPETVTRLRVIKAAQRLGFTLREVADLLDAGHHRRRHVGRGLHQRAAAKLAEVDAKLADLTVIRATLAEVVDAGCDDLTNGTSPDCPLQAAEATGTPESSASPEEPAASPNGRLPLQPGNGA